MSEYVVEFLVLCLIIILIFAILDYISWYFERQDMKELVCRFDEIYYDYQDEKEAEEKLKDKKFQESYNQILNKINLPENEFKILKEGINNE